MRACIGSRGLARVHPLAGPGVGRGIIERLGFSHFFVVVVGC